VNNLDTEVIKDMDDYIPTLLETAWKVPQLRTIPVGQSINHELEVMTYEKAEELVKNHKKFAVNPCICRRERKMVGEGCDKPEHHCLAFGIAADYYIKYGIGRESSKDEIIQMLKDANEHGLVLQPGNSQQVDFICCCCGCCCGVLRTLKKMPRPIEYISTPFSVEANQETCEGCGLCEERCQMEALQLIDDKVSLDLDRCIGCGLCVSTCPTESLALKRRPVDEQYTVPKDGIARAIAHGRSRGKLGTAQLIKMQVKSKVDRFLAPR
jgi:NAD-dependent dihydropyrimidine dehydrogenase PreA subunit